jgi:hypothetical protein
LFIADLGESSLDFAFHLASFCWFAPGYALELRAFDDGPDRRLRRDNFSVDGLQPFDALLLKVDSLTGLAVVHFPDCTEACLVLDHPGLALEAGQAVLPQELPRPLAKRAQGRRLVAPCYKRVPQALEGPAGLWPNRAIALVEKVLPSGSGSRRRRFEASTQSAGP